MNSKFFDLKRYKNYALRKLVGGQITYSQTGEDLIIDLLLGNKKDGVYVDVGANDPFVFNNTTLFHKKGWRGINIDPNSESIAKFKKYRPNDVNLRMGIGKNGTMILYRFKENVLNTFDAQIAENNKKMGHPVVDEERVDILPLSEVLNTHLGGKHIDLLSIDTEGYDREVLESNDWNKFKPTIVIVETLEYAKNLEGKKLNSQFDTYMFNLGYKIIAETYLNTIYIYKQ